MPKHTVLITDYAWPTLDIERAILSEIDASPLVAETGAPDELIRLAPQADAILTCWQQVPPAVLDAAPNCRIVSRYGIGLDNIPVDHATALGILVTNVPDFCWEEVADHVMALLLATARQLLPLANRGRLGQWARDTPQPIPRLRGQTLGLIGYGNIARALAHRAEAFGFNIIAYSPRLASDALGPIGTATNDLSVLLQQSDYISIHTPLTAATAHMIDESALRQMKPNAVLINTARGGVIDETALHRALTEDWIAAAALDVTDPEPPHPDNPLLSLDNVIVTPHAAFYSVQAIQELQTKAARHVVQGLRGETPANLVNPGVLAQNNCRQ